MYAEPTQCKQACLLREAMSYPMPLSSGLDFTSYSTLLYSILLRSSTFTLHFILHSLYLLKWCSHHNARDKANKKMVEPWGSVLKCGRLQL